MQPHSQSSSPRISLPWTVRFAGSSVPSYEAPCARAPDASALRQSSVGERHGTLLAVRLEEAGRGRKEGEKRKKEGGGERGGRKKEEEEEEEEKEVRGERKKRREEGKDESTCARHEHNFHEFLNLTLQLPAFSNVLPNDASVTWTYF